MVLISCAYALFQWHLSHYNIFQHQHNTGEVVPAITMMVVHSVTLYSLLMISKILAPKWLPT